MYLSAGQAEIATKQGAGRRGLLLFCNVRRCAGRDVTIRDINLRKIRAGWAGIQAVMYDRLIRRSENTMNLSIKYPSFNKNIRKSQVIT